MVTTIGTEDKLEDLLSDLIQLDHDAAEAYQAAIDRLGNPGWRTTLEDFKKDHLQHIADLGKELRALGQEPPQEDDAKAILAKGKVVIGSLMGDSAILLAMQTNENDTNAAYERAVQHAGLSQKLRGILEKNLSDERRHRDWIVETLRA